ncbi:uncharacterized protein Dyak_GE27448 [Drosophila yakuba]|uniref:Uncharacterized protein n=1 Tax=Drosophila yakuba TaxID=7245 RepID=A0A0R1DZH9_DROYA|nr:uncharacterized protein Dyak_GE27448 [Drosophila yakuba]
MTPYKRKVFKIFSRWGMWRLILTKLYIRSYIYTNCTLNHRSTTNRLPHIYTSLSRCKFDNLHSHNLHINH